jgi:GNAT superfamily N-acetyltransferase
VDAYALREATLADAPLLARHRRAMFEAMGALRPEDGGSVEAATRRWIEATMPRGRFRAWIVEWTGDGGPTPVAGGGLHVRDLMPRPGYVDGEPEGLIVSMWTDPAHRRRGLARWVLRAIGVWAEANGVRRLVLHASDDGRPLYDAAGFVPTNEMRRESRRFDTELC